MVSGRVSTKTIKRSAHFLLEKYYFQLTMDFQVNKKFCDEVALIPSKNLRNKIAGYVTHLVKRVNRGSIREISLKFQEKEKNIRIENKLSDFISNIKTIDIDSETYKMLEKDDRMPSSYLVNYKISTL
nr:0S ribosomal protein S17 [Cryptomonas curvata]